MARLEITWRGKTHNVELTDELVIGRSPKKGLTIDSPAMSREHARLFQNTSGRWALKDLNSTNGTCVNGAPIKVTRLTHDDEIALGSEIRMRFLDPENAPVAKPIVLKSRAQREREEKDAETARKIAERKAERAALERSIVDTAAVSIDKEEVLDGLLRDRKKLDQLLADEAGGVRFGHYRLLSYIDEGGMGAVFKAEHRLGMRVAIKILRSSAVDPINIARFKQEAWAISAFDHPNIVRVRDLSKVAGMHYIAMDFIKGEDLLAVGVKQSLTVWEVVDVIDKVADALASVHRKNIWHKDIKPQNILLDSRGQPRLIDFGIATVEREHDEATDSEDGMIVGTPAFLSPEQAARGKLGAVDGRADLYSLGAVMYFLLTGRRPFGGKTAREILRRNMTEMPEHPARIHERVPEGLGNVCMKLLAKNPADRYPSAPALRNTLAQWRKTRRAKAEWERTKRVVKARKRRRLQDGG